MTFRFFLAKSAANKKQAQRTTYQENLSNAAYTYNPRVPGFKENTRYEMILEWDLSQVDKKFKYQRLGIKSFSSFEEAVKDCTQFVSMLGRVSSEKGTRGIQVVRIVGIYEVGAFKDWSTDPYNVLDSKQMKERVAEILAASKKPLKGKKQKPISYVKEIDMKVR